MAVPIETLGTEEPVGLLRNKDRTLTPMVEALADCIRAAAHPSAARRGQPAQ